MIMTTRSDEKSTKLGKNVHCTFGGGGGGVKVD